MTLLPRPAAGLLAAVAVLAAGCGDDRRAVYPARGRVVQADGQPAAGATVIFHPTPPQPDDNRHKPAATAGADGAFVLTTYTENDGAPAGDYIATVEWRPARKSLSDVPADKLGGRFRDPATSPFKLSVAKGDNDLPPITLP